MSQILDITKLIMSDISANNNKFWYGTLYDDATIKLEWGRIGAKITEKIRSFDTQYKAETFLKKKIRDKEKKGYTRLDVISNQVISTDSLTEIAKTQIKSDPTTVSLIERLSKENIHNILQSTTIEYQEDTGLFKTPLGIITNSSISSARKVLNDMSNYILNNHFDNPDYHKLLNKYLMLIPQKVGRRLDPETLYADSAAIQAQNDILDSLESSYYTQLSSPQIIKNEDSDDIDQPNIFSCEIRLIDDTDLFDAIKLKFNKTKKQHSCSHLHPKTLYSVKIDDMYNAFKKDGEPIGNIKELWHGTKTANLLSIMKSGLIIPPASNPHVTGRLFADGLYFSDQSTKALNYSYGYWHSSRNDNCFMFMADVAMGKEYVPKDSYEDLPRKGYDSTFAKAGKSGIINNEMIVYNTYQVNLKYLIEFSNK